jgi:hypothetical protein
MDYSSNNSNQNNNHHYKGINNKRLKTTNINSFKPSIFGNYQEPNNVNTVIYTRRNTNCSNMKAENNFYDLKQPSSSAGSNRQKFNSNGSEAQNFNRLFILYPKEASEEDLARAFQKFGRIQAISIIKDQNTQNKKGIKIKLFKIMKKSLINGPQNLSKIQQKINFEHLRNRIH